ncbi:SHOCT domain-containing protein [Noviherbaspirillum album]|nr:SHOCT domain-containing protein [Noviherbaspirillum sp. CPCC 100848]
MEEKAGVRGYPRGGEMADLNRLLQEGAISPEEYELLKRRILAGQVF